MTIFSEYLHFKLLDGNKTTALKDPHSVVLSKKTAIKYFGTDDAVGEILKIKKGDEFENYTVTAVAENSPQNSSIKADMYIPDYGESAAGRRCVAGWKFEYFFVAFTTGRCSCSRKQNAGAV